MAYTPKTWECGEVVTAEALNHIEHGIANAGGGVEPLIISAQSFDDSDGRKKITYDKTWQEVRTAIENSIPCYYNGFPFSWSDVTSLNDLIPSMIPIAYALIDGGTYIAMGAMQGSLAADAPDGLLYSVADLPS